MREYVAVLGGTGFSGASPRVCAAISCVKKNPDAFLVTSGMGFQKDYYERDYVARIAISRGIPLKRILVGRGGNPKRRNSQDDVLQILNALPWDSFKELPRITFFTEGSLHAFRIKGYALLQLPKGRFADIVCVDDGDLVTWRRQLKEVVSVAKFFRWGLGRLKSS